MTFSTRALPVSIAKGHFTGFSPASVTICSYDWATTNARLITQPFDLLVLDEAHYLKNPAAKRTQSVLAKLAHQATTVFALTGTPAPNNSSELWPMLFTFGLTPKTFAQFVAHYCVSIRKDNRDVIVGNQNVEELRQLLSPFMMRRTKAEVLPDLPPIMFSDFVVEPGEVDLERYFADKDAVKELHIVRREIAEHSKTLEDVGKMTRGESNRQLGAIEGMVKAMPTLRRYMGAQKVEAMVELVTSEFEAGAYDKLVIFAMHMVVIEELRYRLRKYNPVTLYGGTSPTKRQANIDRFQKDPKCKVFIGQVQAAGTAINLTAAHHVLFAEYDWVPANNAQAAMRCHRIGQTSPVFVRFAVAAGVIDEVVLKVVRRKSKELAQIFDPVDIFA